MMQLISEELLSQEVNCRYCCQMIFDDTDIWCQ